MRPIQILPLLCLLLAGTSATTQAQMNIESEVELTPFADGVWLHTSYAVLRDGTRFPSHGLVVREGDTLVLVDTAWGVEQTENLLEAIDAEIGLPISGVVVTHFHADRLGGADLLAAEGAEVWAHPLTPGLAKERGGAVPEFVFEELQAPGDTAPFGNLEVFYPGPAHTYDNIMVWLPEQQILFAGCPVRGAEDKNMGNVRDGDLAHWPTAMKLADERYGSAKHVVASHSEPAGPELFGHTAYLARLAADEAAAEE